MTLKSLYNLFATHPEGQWIMVPDNAQSLYQFIKEHPIRNILDLGTGIGLSASVMALALLDKGEERFHIDSVEQSEKCVKIANDLIPPELKEYITIHHRKVAVWETEHIPYQYFSVYESLPDKEFDFWLNDGPAPFVEKDQYIELPNATVTKALLEDKIKPGTMIAWDGRIVALQTLERYFGDNFYLARPAKGGQDDLNVIERKDNPVKFNDIRYEAMEKTSYFRSLPQSV